MFVKQKITVEVQMSSGVSESDLCDHFRNYVADMKNTINDMTSQSWQNTIHTSWDESSKVDITCIIEEKELTSF